MKIYQITPEHCSEEKIGISYSGAGERGVVHLGIAKAFVDLKIIPHHIAGVSSGSIAAAAHAFNPGNFETLELAIKVSKGLRREHFGLSFWQIFWRILAQGLNLQSLGDLEGLKKVLEENTPFHDFEEMKVPLSISTTDRLNGQEVWLEKGPVVDAIIASSSLPVAFPPVKSDGNLYVDGGVSDPLPLFKLAGEGCGTIFAVNLGYAGETRQPPRNLLENLVGSIDIAYYQSNRYEVALINAIYPELKVIEIKPEVAFNLPPFSFTPEKIDPIVEEAFQKSRELIIEKTK